MLFSLCFVLEVFFPCGNVRSWGGCCLGATYGSLCYGNMWGESGRVGCIRSRV